MPQATRIVKMVKAGAMVFKVVVPGVSGNTKKQELLEEDLCLIGCHGFLEKPWNLKMEEMVAELMGEKDNWWHKIVRQALEKWTLGEWWKVYRFLSEMARQGKARQRDGKGMASQIDQFIDGILLFHSCQSKRRVCCFQVQGR